MQVDRARRLVAETLGTALLVAAVVGSGIMAAKLAGGNAAIALLANSIATGGALVALILAFGPISGAHFNPVVSLAMTMQREQHPFDAALYATVQIGGGIGGAILANVMFELPPITWSMTGRSGTAQLVSEAVAAFGLVGVVIAVSRTHARAAPYAVAAYIVAAYWFTASTSFANPAVTIARAFSDTFAGIRLADVSGFVGAQLAGAIVATLLFGWLVPRRAVVSR
jgi:glycerol uptake facilitator-like aquaporin